MNKVVAMFGYAMFLIGFISTVGLTGGIRADVGSGSFYSYQYVFLIPLVIAGYAHWKNNQLISTISLMLCIMIAILLGAFVLFYDHERYSEVYDVYLNKNSLYMGYVVMVVGLIIDRNIIKRENYHLK